MDLTVEKEQIEAIAILVGNRFVYKLENFDISEALILKSIRNPKLNTITIDGCKLYIKILGTNSHNENILLVTGKKNRFHNFYKYELQQFEHDVREPLKNISNFLSLIETAISLGKKDDAKKYINFVFEAIKILNNISKEIFTKSKLKNNEVELKSLINDIVLLNKTQVEQYNLKISIGDNIPKLFGNYTILLRLFKNLIENSMIHSNNNEVHIIIKPKSIQNGFIVIVYEDNNLLNNIDIDNINFILQGEIKPENSKGLMICKDIIEKLNGKLELNKNSNNLSYDITLPLFSYEENENN